MSLRCLGILNLVDKDKQENTRSGFLQRLGQKSSPSPPWRPGRDSNCRRGQSGCGEGKKSKHRFRGFQNSALMRFPNSTLSKSYGHVGVHSGESQARIQSRENRIMLSQKRKEPEVNMNAKHSHPSPWLRLCLC